MDGDETRAFLNRVLATYDSPTPHVHAVVERSTAILAGYTGLAEPRFLPEVLPAIEVGWRLGERFRGRGYATEAAAAVLDWGFVDLALTEVLSIAEPINAPSLRVMDHLEFTPRTATTHPALGWPLVVRSLGADAWDSRR